MKMSENSEKITKSKDNRSYAQFEQDLAVEGVLAGAKLIKYIVIFVIVVVTLVMVLGE